MDPIDTKLLKANPTVREPTFVVRNMTADEVESVGRKRWAGTHRQGAQIATVIMVLTAVYALMTFTQLGAPHGRWLIAGLVVPLVILMVVGIRDGNAARKAAREFLKNVKAGRN